MSRKFHHKGELKWTNLEKDLISWKGRIHKGEGAVTELADSEREGSRKGKERKTVTENYLRNPALGRDG